MTGKLLEGQIDEEAECSDVVDDVDGCPDKEELVRARDEAHDDLDGEPRVAHGFDVKEGFMGVGLRLVQRPSCRVGRRLDRYIPDHRTPHVRMCFQAERQDRDADKEDRDQPHDLYINRLNKLLS